MKKAFFVLVTLALILILVSLSYAKSDEKWKDKLDSDLRKAVEKQDNIFSMLSEKKEETIDVIVTTGDKNLENFGTVKKKFSIIPAVAMSVPAGRLEQIARLPEVERIEKEKIFYIQRLQAMPLIRADSASGDYGLNGTNVNISILDTGVFSHAEFQTPNRIILQKDFYNNDDEANDDHGHGTHVAGIAAGEGGSNGRGVAANASMLAVKVCGATDAQGCPFSDVVSGIEWSVGNNTRIISMSLGGNYSCYNDGGLSAAVDNATEQGVLVVVSAGNTGPNNNTIASPACAKRALAVGSVNDSSALSGTVDNVTYFSSRGAINDNRTKPDLVAPGIWITSTYNDGGYATRGGTSMAAPFVSGVAALVLEQYNKTFGYFPEPERTKAILLAAANTSGMEAEGFVRNGNPYRNNYYGSGRIDAYKSLQITNFTSNDTITQGQQKLVYFNITNSNASIVLVWGEDGTTYNNLDLIVGNGTNNFTTGADRNDTVEHIFLRNANNGTWNIYVNGTSVSGSQKFFVASDMSIFSDAYSPKWSANTSNPTSPANYIKNGNYSFNITWTDDVAVDEAVFEWNGTNYSYKKGNVSKYGSVFSANLADLAVGNYSFKWYANDTSGKWNSSDSWNYSVARAAPNIAILLNNSAGNITIASGDFVNATAYGGEGNISLYRNGSLVNNTPPPIYNLTSYIGTAGTIFNITAFHNQTENFTAQTVARFIIMDNASPVFSGNTTYPASPAPYGNRQFNITWLDETNISTVFLEFGNATTLTNYTVTGFSGSGSYNSSKEFYRSFSDISIGNYTYRWLANDSMNNWNSTQNLTYSIMQAASRSRLFLNGTENNATYTISQIANISALLNVSGKNTTIFANFSGSHEMIASNNTPSAYNITNTSNLNVSSVFNITAGFAGDENYTASSVTYYLGLCPVCPSSSRWTSCSGNSQSRTVYSCNPATNYQCQSSTEAQSCSSGSSSSGSSSGSSGVSASSLSTTVAEPAIKVTSSGESTTVSISSVQADSRQVINITNSSLPIKEIVFFPSEAVTNAKVEMRIAAAPSSQKPEGEVFQYLSIEKANISFRNSTDIRFFTTKKWVSDNDINISTVSLNRLSGNWTKLPTDKTGEDSEKFYFKSATPGFSYFAITGEKNSAAVANNATSIIAGVAKDNTEEKERINNTILVIGILAIIIAIPVLLFSILLTIYILKYKKRIKTKVDNYEKEEQ